MRAVVGLFVVLACAGAGRAAVSTDATTCAIGFQVRVSNLDCAVSGPAIGVTLDGRISERVLVRGGETARFSYDTLGRPVAVDLGGQTTSYVYDDAGRLVRGAASGVPPIDYAYDAAGRLISAGDWKFGYSDQGLVRAVAPDGSATEYTYDSQGELLTANAGSDIARFAYGSQRRVIRVATASETIDYSYDRAGEPVARTDGSTTTQYQYDRQRNLSRSADDSGTTVQFDYDGDGSLLQVSTGGVATSFAYAANGQLVEARGPSGDTSAFVYLGGLLAAVAPDVGDEVVVSFEQGEIGKPYVVGYLYSDAAGNSFRLSVHGRLSGCNRCP